MKANLLLATSAMVLSAGIASAQVWGPGIVIDGEFDDWDGQVPALVAADPSGDGGGGRDISDFYVANDQNNLYIRIVSYDTNAFDGNEFFGIDGDNSDTTGFNLFGAGLGSDTLIAGASVFGETTASFNSGAATPGSVAWGPFVASTSIELAIQLGTTIPGDIANSFPGGLGSTIALLYGDGNVGSPDVVSGTYTLASGSSATPDSTIDDFTLYDNTANAQGRTRDGVSTGGFTYVLDNFAPGGPGGGGDTALQAAHSNAATAFGLGVFAHRFATPLDITGHIDVTLDVFGDTNITDQQIWVGLLDTDGTYYAVSAAAPNTASWNTLTFGPTSGWFQQAAGADAGELDLDAIIEWRIGLQEASGAGGSFTLAYDNLLAPIPPATVSDWTLFED